MCDDIASTVWWYQQSPGGPAGPELTAELEVS